MCTVLGQPAKGGSPTLSPIALHRLSSPSLHAAHRILREFWNHTDFRFHQRKAVIAALTGRDCLAVLPTGAGKSICFQVPALLLPGVTLVVSPLISLMQDQVTALQHRGIRAAYLSSTQRPHVQAAVWQALEHRRVRLLYVAPERLPQLAATVPRLDVSLLAVDEAHCISEWGHDFRPHYRALGKHRRTFGRPATIAVTATATPTTRADIVRVLGLERPVTIVQTFDRRNLFFGARRFRRERDRLRALAQLLRRVNGTAIAYVPTRERTDGVASILRYWGFAAAPYHAGLPGPARRALLTQFLDGRVRVMVATNAFGMGIDKPDVRLVAHLGVPPRPEAYFQEAGRAGRDGAPARCEVLWMEADLALTSRMVGRAGTTSESRSAVYSEARKRGFRAMQRYVATRGCRRRVLLEYLGERLERCAGCDRCGEFPG